MYGPEVKLQLMGKDLMAARKYRAEAANSSGPDFPPATNWSLQIESNFSPEQYIVQIYLY